MYNLYYEIIGNGKPIIMLHGYSVDHRIMSGIMEPIFQGRGDDYQRIYLDLPGMGQTKAEPWLSNADQMLEIIIDFINTILPGQNFLIAGESYGCYLARGVVYKMTERVDGLMFICPAIISDIDQRQLPQRTVLVKDEVFLATLSTEELQCFGEMMVVKNEQTWKSYSRDVLSGVKVADKVFLEKFKALGRGYSFDVDSGKKFVKPSLIITGRQDHIVGYKDAWDILHNYPRATFAVLDKAGHNAQIEQKKVVGSLINEWLDRVES